MLNHYPPRLALAALLTLVPGGPALAAGPSNDSAALKAASALYENIRVETLDNGLRVYLKPIPGAATVTTMVAYKVGSSDEELTATGLSHYLEHLMFKGTDKIMPSDIDRLTQRNGGANNANTSEDMTVYHFDFAADRWLPALQIEADRMRNIRIDDKHEFQQEKGAVINELKRDEDEPWDLESKAILPILFGKTNPYGHPVIGEREHVLGATAKVIKEHYDKWYYPNNAALVIVGGIDPDKALAKVKELFGSIPRGELPPRKAVTAYHREGPVRVDMKSKFEVPRLLFGYNAVDTSDPDHPALSVLEGILSTGKTCRLYKKLIEGAEVASDIGASNQSGRYPGWFSVQVEVLKGKDPEQVEKLVLEEIKRLAGEPVSAAELKRIQEGIVANAIFGRESVHGLADSIARGVTTNDLAWLKNYLPRILAVTPADVQRVARKYLDPQKRVLVRSLPSAERGARSAEREAPAAVAGSGPARSTPSAYPALRESRSGDGTEALSLEQAKRVVLPNGLTLLLLENHRLPLVVAEATVKNVRLLEPADKQGLATLTGYLLDDGGTADHTGPQIAELIEDVGGTLSLSAGGGSVRVLAPDRKLGLSLLFDCLSRPAFAKDAFARDQARLLSSIDEAESQPDSKAARTFQALVYGKHPYGRPALGTRSSVEKLTPADCTAFHAKAFTPENTIVAVVGDFNTDQVVEEIKQLTSGWKPADIKLTPPPAVEMPAGFEQKVVTMPQAAQLHFFLGHVGVRRNDPDYYKLLVMDNVLGTGPGFTDRLSARMRDREGLAYTVRANVTDSATTEPGTFSCYIGTDNDKFDRVKAEFLEELNRIRAEKPTQQEVDDAKMYLLGSLPFKVSTSAQVAAQLLAIERYGLGLNYLDDYRKAVAAVTPADVQEMARKHIDPKRMVLVAAGAVDQDGKPLAKLPPGRARE
jgi:zinc protease